MDTISLPQIRKILALDKVKRDKMNVDDVDELIGDETDYDFLHFVNAICRNSNIAEHTVFILFTKNVVIHW